MGSRKWLYPGSVSISPALLDLAQGDEIVARLMVRRGIHEPAAARVFLHSEQFTPTSPYAFPQMEAAVTRIFRAIEEHEVICVWGDFDVDGQTSTALLVSVLDGLGADVRYHIPIRAVESHGMKVPALEQEINAGAELILTCDTGISAHAAVAFANQAGVDVIITDHHDLPQNLPPAIAILNPKQLPADHPLRELPGVGCAYKLAEALLEKVGHLTEKDSLLDLVALGIVADVAVQKDEVRYLLQRGLRVLKSTPRAGLRSLFQLARIDPDKITETDIGFSIAPRMNALGRLDDANAAVEFLTTTNETAALELATRLETLNAKRRMLVDHIAAAADARLQKEPELLEQGVLVLEAAGWPGGIIGIVASRLVEKYNQPTILLSIGVDGIARGSARSLKGVDISAAISTQKDVLIEFGGHPMAAGMSLDASNVLAFRRNLGAEIQRMLEGRELVAELEIDAVLPWSNIDLDLAKRISCLAPFGAGNPIPIFAVEDVEVVGIKALGQDGRHVKLTVRDAGETIHEVVHWNGASTPVPEGRFNLAYTLHVNSFRGVQRLQLEWVDAQKSVVQEIAASKPAGIEIVDLREVETPLLELEAYQSSDCIIWAEGQDRGASIGLGRHELHSAGTLVIWTAPSSQEVLRAVLRKVSPKNVVLIAQDPGWQNAEEFLKRLAGVSKRAIAEQRGRVDMEVFAAVCACTETAVRLGLEWQVAQGYLQIDRRQAGGLWIAVTEMTLREESQVRAAGMALQGHLHEIRAYRTYFQKAGLDRVLSGA